MSSLSVAFAKKVLKMMQGETLPASSLQGEEVNRMLDEGILTSITHKSRKSYRINHLAACRLFLASNYGITEELEQWIAVKSNVEATRAEQVKIGGDSKLRATRTFKGFPITCYEPIQALLRGEPFTIGPAEGTSILLRDFDTFRIPKDVIVVGMENGENFQFVREQRYLFPEWKVLFVSRYPQSKDLLRWLEMISNRYVHFGDFDLAGVHIYLSEFYALLKERATFFIPDDVEERISCGSRKRYDEQYTKYKDMAITDQRLLSLVQLIHKYRRGYDQEGYILGLTTHLF